MDAATDPAVREIWVMKSAQVGWTEILNNVLGFFADQDPSPILLVQPTLEMGEAYSKDRLAPMIRDTPRLASIFPDPRSRDAGNTLLHKAFPGGHLTIAGSNSPASLASRPIRVVAFDEVDKFPASAGVHGDPISLGKKRATTFWNRIVLGGSTPTVKGSSRIEAAFDLSDQRYYWVPCTHCGEFQRLIWQQVRWHEGRPETAVYVCQHCGTALTDLDKPDMLARGEWRASRKSDGIAGFHISELYSPWVSFPEMARSFLEAKKLPDTLQEWINETLGETWEDRGETVEPVGLMARREHYGAELIPQGVMLLTAGVDTQADRLEVKLLGWGRDEECWVIEQHVLRGDPGGKPLWADLDQYLGRRYVTEDGRTLWVESTCVDSGGHYSQAVYRYCGERRRWRVFAIKGQGGAGRLAWPKQASKPKRGGQVFVIGVDSIKELLYARLAKIREPGPGYIHFPQAVDEAYFAQLTSETKIYKQLQGRRIGFWRPKSAGAAQEAQDCWVYGYAALLARSTDLNARADMVARVSPRPPDAARKDLRDQVPAGVPTRTRRVRSRGVS